jgi:hypothetical protein
LLLSFSMASVSLSLTDAPQGMCLKPDTAMLSPPFFVFEFFEL